MKKITFNYSSFKADSLNALVKEIKDNISCKLYVDFRNHLVIAQDVENTDSVIDLIHKYCTLESVDIDNTCEIVEETTHELIADASKVETEVTKTSVDSKTEFEDKTPNNIEPKTEDDLIIPKIEFENAYIEGCLNKLSRVLHWAIFKKDMSEHDLGNIVYTCINEFYMNNFPKKSIQFSIGDVVDCNYGYHLKGEINGNHVLGIVCDILNEDMVYIVPILKSTDAQIMSRSYMDIILHEDIQSSSKYISSNYVALLDKGKYIRVERLLSVEGKTSPEFFKRLVSTLANKTFDFTKNIDGFSINEVDGSFGDTSAKKSRKSSVDSTLGIEEAEILKIVGSSLDALDKNNSIEENTSIFIKNIGLSEKNAILKEAFIIACSLDCRISFKTLLPEFGKKTLYATVREEIIRSSLTVEFGKWLRNYPELKEKSPKVSIISLLKVFAKNIKTFHGD